MLKAIATDFEILYRINQTVWPAHRSLEFIKGFEEFSRFYFESENSPFKRLPQLGVSAINNFITLFISLTCCVILDLSYRQLHAALPSVFYAFEPDFSYLNWKKVWDQTCNFVYFGGLYNWFFYFGRNGWFSMNTTGSVAKRWNRFAAAVERLMIPVYGAATLADKNLQSAFGDPWEILSNGIRIYYNEGLFGFTKYIKYRTPKYGNAIGTVLEIVVGSANTMLNAVLFASNASLTLAQKLALATQKPAKFIMDTVAPSFLLNVIRASAQTKISQNPQNDPVSAQILRTVNGVASGGVFYAVNSHRDVMHSALFYLAQLGLGRMTHIFADTTNNESVRDRFAVLWESARKKLFGNKKPV